MNKIIVVMPAYNAEKTLENTIKEIPFEYVNEIIMVDDASKDKTVEKVKKIIENHHILTLDEKDKNKKIFHIIKHPKNLGYGGNQKTCYNFALERSADFVIMLHPDYQYDPKKIKEMVEVLKKEKCEVVLGSRIRSKKEALKAGMPFYKYLANRFLTILENKATGYVLTEWHTGMRGYTQKALENTPYNTFSNDFIFDTQMLFGFVKNKYKIEEISVPVRYFKEASSINFKRSLVYGVLTLFEILKFLCWKTEKYRKKYINIHKLKNTKTNI